MADQDWKLVVHGGAGVIQRGRISPDRDRMIRAALDAALQQGSAVLSGAGTAVAAVEAAVRVLEDDSSFNAGRGAVLTYDGRIELDASIMDGRDRSAGAVTGICASRSPVSLARTVMEESDHVFLSGPEADAFGREHGIEQVDPSFFESEFRRKQLAELKSKNGRARSTSNINMARSAPSRSTGKGMWPPPPRPAA